MVRHLVKLVGINIAKYKVTKPIKSKDTKVWLFCIILSHANHFVFGMLVLLSTNNATYIIAIL